MEIPPNLLIAAEIGLRFSLLSAELQEKNCEQEMQVLLTIKKPLSRHHRAAVFTLWGSAGSSFQLLV